MRATVALCVVALGCTREAATPTPPEPLPVCGDFELGMPDGTCVRPGIPPDACAAGFVHDGAYGCTPTLPETPCAEGLMAIAGESACRPVMTCPTDKWGGIPIDASTEHVDAAYAGTDSDGTAQRPWVRIGDAIARAAPDAVIAVAEGNYPEDVETANEPVRIYGVCPERVAIVGQGGQAALFVSSFASGTRIRGVGVESPTLAIVVSGSEDVVVEQAWIHDSAARGVNVEDTLGSASLTIRDSLIERNGDMGVYVAGARIIVERSVVRQTSPRVDDTHGHGIHAQVSCTSQGCNANARASIEVRDSLIEQNHEVGVSITGSDGLLEALVVRGTQPNADQLGRGIHVGPVCPASGACDPNARASVTVRGSFVAQNHEVGLAISGSDGSVDTTVVRDTRPQPSSQTFGRGIVIQADCDGDACNPAGHATASVSRSLVEDNHDLAVTILGADAELQSIVVRGTLPDAASKLFGRGINIQLPCSTLGCDASMPSRTTISGSLVERSHDAGIFIGGSEASIAHTVVRDARSRALDDRYGDGIALVSLYAQASASIEATRIEQSARAGIASFGGVVSLASTQVTCAGFELEGEIYRMQPFVFEDGGGNRCGCPTPERACTAVSASLDAPESFGPPN